MTAATPMSLRADLFSAFEVCTALGLTPAQFRRAASILGLAWKAAYTLHERDDLREIAPSVEFDQ